MRIQLQSTLIQTKNTLIQIQNTIIQIYRILYTNTEYNNTNIQNTLY